jgi:hypothetical protein
MCGEMNEKLKIRQRPNYKREMFKPHFTQTTVSHNQTLFPFYKCWYNMHVNVEVYV